VRPSAPSSGPCRWGAGEIIVTILSLIAFAALGIAAHAHPYFSWDLSLATRLQQLPLRLPMKLVSAPGYGWRAVALTGFTALLFWMARHKPEGVFLALSASIGALLDELAKALIARPRPRASLVAVSRHLSDPSFPSGHVVFYCSYFGFLFALAYLHRRRAPLQSRVAMVLTAIPIVLVGISRIYLGVHWPSDVLGGYLLGAAWLPLPLHAYRRWKARAPPQAAPNEG
jgi:membrane-associated phospholipid phosphatase